MMLARQLGGDGITKLIKRGWQEFKLKPAEVVSMTPAEVMLVFMPKFFASEEAEKPESEIDKLARANADRGRAGLRPYFPLWYRKLRTPAAKPPPKNTGRRIIRRR